MIFFLRAPLGLTRAWWISWLGSMIDEVWPNNIRKKTSIQSQIRQESRKRDLAQGLGGEQQGPSVKG